MAASRSPIPMLLLVLPAAALFLMLLSALGPGLMAATQSVDYAISHAVDRHGNSAVLVRNCLNDKGAMQVWYNPATGRQARICQLDNGKFGVQILNDKLQEITGFIKDKMTRIDQVTNYLKNAGYYPLQ